ncbi:MAG: DUF4097 family beta strand repeat-containing protein [Terriglobales bacterium]
MIQRTLRAAAGLAVVIILTAGASAADKKEFRYNVNAGASVTVVNDYGTVRVRAAQPGTVVATAVPGSSKVEVDAAQSGNRVELRTHYLQQTGESDGRVDYEIQVPADANVMVRTASGPVQVQGVSGDVVVDTDTGKVDVRNCNAHVRVRTVGGPITLVDLNDSFVEATSVGGQVSLNNVTGKSVSVNTTGGPITYAGDFAGGGVYSLSTHSGNIDLKLPASASVDVTARSVTGAVENDFPLTPPVHPTMALAQGKSLAGTSNSGASSVHLRTFSGRIRVKKQ